VGLQVVPPIGGIPAEQGRRAGRRRVPGRGRGRADLPGPDAAGEL